MDILCRYTFRLSFVYLLYWGTDAPVKVLTVCFKLDWEYAKEREGLLEGVFLMMSSLADHHDVIEEEDYSSVFCPEAWSSVQLLYLCHV